MMPHPKPRLIAAFKPLLLATAGLAALVLSGCATAAGEPSATRAAAAPAVAAVEAPAMWVVRDADTTIWLFGTIHALPKDLAWHQDQVRAAMAASDTLVMELPGDPAPEEMAGLMFPAGLNMDGPPLSSRLTPAQMTTLTEAITAIGIPAPMIDRLQPWLANVMLAAAVVAKTGIDPESGVEKVLGAFPEAAGKPRVGLETAAEQIGFFRTMPEAATLSMLAKGIDEWGSVETDLAEMVRVWRTGDEAGLDRVMHKGFEGNPEARKVLLGDRNQRWARWIDARMDQPGTVMVAVGAGHLTGFDSVQAFLSREGHTAQRVPATR
jgi:uncharacterized protein